MKKEEVRKLYERAIQRWGRPAQITMAIEECAELIKVLAKQGRKTNGSTYDQILEEMADVEIMLGQLKMIFNYNFQLTPPHSKFHAIKYYKLKRLKKRLGL